ncbi:MAG: GNAT family N-acetyltransferase [Acidobacteriota bacterium]
MPARQAIRRARAQDAAELARLEQRAFGPPRDRPWSRDQLREELAHRAPGAPGRDAWVFQAPTGALIGYALFSNLGAEAELLRLAVDPEARRCGVAARLLRCGLRSLSRGGCLECFLEVREDNGAALGLYRGAGFSSCGRRPGYYPDGCAALLLRKSLKAETGKGA